MLIPLEYLKKILNIFIKMEYLRMNNKSIIKGIFISSILLILVISSTILVEARPNANLIINGSFETTSLSQWDNLQGFIERDGTTASDGTFSLKVTADDHLLNPNKYYTLLYTIDIAVTAGQYYDYSFAVKGSYDVIIKADLKWNNGATTWCGSFGNTVSWQPFLFQGTVQAPAGSSSVRFYFHNIEEQDSSFYWHLDNVQFNYPSAPEFEPTIMISILGLFIFIILIVKQRK